MRYEFKAEGAILFIEDSRGAMWVDVQNREVIENVEEAEDLYAYHGILEQFEIPSENI